MKKMMYIYFIDKKNKKIKKENKNASDYASGAGVTGTTSSSASSSSTSSSSSASSSSTSSSSSASSVSISSAGGASIADDASEPVANDKSINSGRLAGELNPVLHNRLSAFTSASSKAHALYSSPTFTFTFGNVAIYCWIPPPVVAFIAIFAVSKVLTFDSPFTVTKATTSPVVGVISNRDKITLNTSVPFPVSAWIGPTAPEVDTAITISITKAKVVILFVVICKVFQHMQ